MALVANVTDVFQSQSLDNVTAAFTGDSYNGSETETATGLLTVAATENEGVLNSTFQDTSTTQSVTRTLFSWTTMTETASSAVTSISTAFWTDETSKVTSEEPLNHKSSTLGNFSSFLSSTAAPLVEQVATTLATENGTEHWDSTVSYASSQFPAIEKSTVHLLTVEEADDKPPKNDIKELVYVVIVIAFYSAALLTLIILQIRRYYTRHTNYTSFGDEGGGEGYDLYEDYSENRQLIFQEARRQSNERKVRNIQGINNGYIIDTIPEHVV